MIPDPTLQVVLETSLDAVIVMRADGSLADWNAQAERIFGWSRDEVVGREMADLIVPPQHREAHHRGLRHYLATGEGPVLRRRIEITALRRTGEEFPIELSITPVERDGAVFFLGFLRDITVRLRSAQALARQQEHQALLLAELNHRAKNLLAVVMGMASQTAKGAPSVEHFTTNFSARLVSLSRAYSLLTSANWEPTTLKALVEEVVRPHVAAGSAQLSLNGAELLLPPKAALSVSMILHELATNAVKHGALKGPDGRLVIEWAVDGHAAVPAVRLIWKEDGVGPLTAPSRRGFGTKLIEAVARHELAGHVQTSYGPGGISHDFQFPQSGRSAPSRDVAAASALDRDG